MQHNVFESRDALGSSKKPYSISDLNAITRQVVEGHWSAAIWVSGEVSNVACPASGHWYFSLKDNRSQIACVMFRYAQSGSVIPEPGDSILVLAQVSLYEGRGHFQLLVSRIVLDGIGALAVAFDRLKKKLLAEGLFAEQHKKNIPCSPKTIGLIASLGSAGLQDMLKVLRQRSPLARVFIYPALVQGESAPASLIKALMKAEAHGVCDVLVLARGGGSFEDLFCFNDETLVRSVYACGIPIVTGIGHETDTTICDFVADRRAATPTQAATFAASDDQYNHGVIQEALSAMQREMRNRMHMCVKETQEILARLNFPRALLGQLVQWLDERSTQLNLSFDAAFQVKQSKHRACVDALCQNSPLARITEQQDVLGHHYRLCYEAIQGVINRQREQLVGCQAALKACDPQQVLSRGYAMVSDHAGRGLSSFKQAKVGDQLGIQLSDGVLRVVVASSDQVESEEV
jgi:exodeoxyribonuclease VII large subunit